MIHLDPPRIPTGLRPGEPSNRSMLRARDAIDRHYSRPLGIPAPADIAMVSPAHFIRRFSRTLGETPHRYLQRRRIERAMALLRTTTRSVTEICFEVGFGSLGTFSRTARTAAPIDAPEGSFIYTSSERVDLAIRPGVEFGLDDEFVAYLLPSTREVWRQPETEFIQIHTTNHTPTFFNPDAEAAYYQLGLDAADRLDEVQSEQLTGVTDPILDVDWPTEPDALYEALRDYAASATSPSSSGRTSGHVWRSPLIANASLSPACEAAPRCEHLASADTSNLWTLL